MATNDIFPRTEETKLPENTAQWPEAITALISKRYPKLANVTDKVYFTNIDKVRGNSVGHVTMSGGQWRVPFIISSFKLKTLDTFIKGERYGHLSEREINRLVSDSWPFKAIPKDKMQSLTKVAAMSLTDMTPSQILGDYVFMKAASEIQKTMPALFERIDSAIRESGDICKIASEVKNDFEKVASITTGKNGVNLRLIKLARADEEISVTEGVRRFGKDVIARVLQGDDIHLKLQDTGIQPWRTPSENASLEKYPVTVNYWDGALATVRGNVYKVKNIADKSDRGHVFVATEKDAYTMVRNGDHRQFYAVPGRGTSVPASHVDQLVRAMPSEYRNRAFAVLHHDVIYGPFEIIAYSDMAGTKILRIRDGFEYNAYSLFFSNKFTSIQIDKDNIIAPTDARLIWLGQPLERPGIFEKRAAAVQVRLSASVDRRSFSLFDNGVSGYPAGALNQLDKTKAVNALMHCGLTEEEAKNAVSEALAKGSYSFNATPTATKTEDQTREEIKEDPAVMKKTAATIREIVEKSDLVKLAYDRGDEESVDIALGLRMITPETVKRYRLLIPRITESLHGLSQLLMAKRLGGKEVPVDESNLTNSIEGLSRVSDELTGF